MKEYKGYLADEDGRIYSKRTMRRLTPHVGSDGYMQVCYRDDQGKTIHERVHVIMAHCFLPNPNNLKYVNHLDSNKQNNELSNLEQCTNSYNVQHGQNSGNRLHRNYTAIRIAKNGEEPIEFRSIRKACEFYKLDRHKVARILKGELPKDYLENYKIDYVM